MRTAESLINMLQRQLGAESHQVNQVELTVGTAENITILAVPACRF